MNTKIVYVTFPNKEEAISMSETAIKNSLCACVNLIPQMESIYKWEGNIEHSKEVVALFKSSEQKHEELAQWIQDNHSYSCPCIITLEPSSINQIYQDWLNSQI